MSDVRWLLDCYGFLLEREPITGDTFAKKISIVYDTEGNKENAMAVRIARSANGLFWRDYFHGTHFHPIEDTPMSQRQEAVERMLKSYEECKRIMVSAGYTLSTACYVDVERMTFYVSSAEGCGPATYGQPQATFTYAWGFLAATANVADLLD